MSISEYGSSRSEGIVVHPRGGHPVGRKGDGATQRRAPVLSERVLMDMAVVVELALVVLAGLLARQIYIVGHLELATPLFDYLPPLVAVVPLMYWVFREYRLFPPTSGEALTRSVAAIAGALILTFALLVVAGYLVGIVDYYSRAWAVLWLVLSIVAVSVSRALLCQVISMLAEEGHMARRVAVIGAGDRLGGVERQLLEGGRPARQNVVARCDLDADGASQADVVGELIAFGQRERMDRIVVATDGLARERITEVVDRLSVLPVEIVLASGNIAPGMPVRAATQNGDLTLLEVQRRPLADHGVWLKALEDYVLGALACLVFAPVMALCALAIRLESPGPIFFKQRRHGYNHALITVWKFRTMRVMEDGPVIRQASKDDDRVTRVGRFLRRTSLDELPQLINVMRGEMSLVGPRPHAIAHNELYSRMLRRYANRHRVKPGITGLAQINGFRGPTDDPELMRMRVLYDLEYIDNWSIWLDLRILIATPFVGFVNRNAF
ncbi:MAG: undecaprenyl-phosphate glucose phosphotransferase [Rhizobiales bacterium]|nr:undecaprenyl-phosphate glucose phosphotransferase [Hyphomicrobiales bacterium]